MIAKFQNQLININAYPLSRQKELLIEVFNEWKGNFEQTDDVLVVGIRF